MITPGPVLRCVSVVMGVWMGVRLSLARVCVEYAAPQRALPVLYYIWGRVNMFFFLPPVLGIWTSCVCVCAWVVHVRAANNPRPVANMAKTTILHARVL